MKPNFSVSLAARLHSLTNWPRFSLGGHCADCVGVGCFIEQATCIHSLISRLPSAAASRFHQAVGKSGIGNRRKGTKKGEIPLSNPLSQKICRSSIVTRLRQDRNRQIDSQTDRMEAWNIMQQQLSERSVLIYKHWRRIREFSRSLFA